MQSFTGIRLNTQLITLLFLAFALLLILVLEYATSPGFVFGYLYTGPIILSFWRISRQVGSGVTFLACTATLLNIWLPWFELPETTTVLNRVIAVLALVVTGCLSSQARRYEEMLHVSQAQLSAQKQLVKVREDFMATLTHDLRTPILGAIETLGHLREDLTHFSQDQLRQTLEVLERGSRGQLQLIETLLEVYRVDNTGLALNPEPLDLAVTSTEILSTLQDLANRRAIRLSYTGLAEAWIYADPVQLRRVLSNLLINSLNHTPQQGSVSLTLSEAPATKQLGPQDSVQHQPARYILTISDTGRGIPVVELEHVFERFYRGQRKRQALGTGLGLYLARQIVEAHGGHIDVKNRATGGLSVTVELPHGFEHSSTTG